MSVESNYPGRRRAEHFHPAALRQERVSAELTVFELACLSGVHQRTIQRWEDGDCIPSDDTYSKVVSALSKI